MYDITRFTFADMAHCGAELREVGADASSLEAAADAIVRHLYENLRDAKGRACAMVRLYATHAFVELPLDLRDAGRDLPAETTLTPDTKCMTLLGAAGDLPEWNDRRTAPGYRTIPLSSRSAIDSIPIVAEMVRQFGLDFNVLLESWPLSADLEARACNVFFVPEAQTSSFLPAQAEFVVPFGIKSVLGFGGVLPWGNLFAVLMFTRAPISADTAQMFRTIALSVKMNMLRFTSGKVFAG
jgi:hypothetical protein